MDSSSVLVLGSPIKDHLAQDRPGPAQLQQAVRLWLRVCLPRACSRPVKARRRPHI